MTYNGVAHPEEGSAEDEGRYRNVADPGARKHRKRTLPWSIQSVSPCQLITDFWLPELWQNTFVGYKKREEQSTNFPKFMKTLPLHTENLDTYSNMVECGEESECTTSF